jgi:hypothetical protein
MKTVHEYEVSDIDLTDPVHGFLSVVVMSVLVRMMGKPHEASAEWAEEFMKRAVADALTAAERQGIVIAKGEPIPEAFRKG